MVLELPRKIVLRKQLKEIAEPLRMTTLELVHLLNDMNVLRKNENGELEIIPPEKQKEKESYIFGSEAVVALCEDRGVEITPLTKIDIPVSVVFECNPEAWYDISILAARVENRIHRVKRLTELQAPMIILKNEDRMLQEAVEILETNGGPFKPVTRGETGRTMRSLSDVGYSLLDGWCPEMLAEFESRDAELAAEQDDQEQEEE